MCFKRRLIVNTELMEMYNIWTHNILYIHIRYNSSHTIFRNIYIQIYLDLYVSEQLLNDYIYFFI